MRNLTTGNPWKTFFKFSAPLIGASLLSQAYSTIDLIIAGKAIGDRALAALGASSAFFSFLTLTVNGYGSGASVYTAKLFGAGDYRRVKKAACSNLALIVLVSFLFSLGAILFRTPILNLLKVDAAIRADAEIYYIIYAAGITLYLYNSISVSIIHSLGDSLFCFLLSGVSGILNVAGNIVSTSVLHLGVAGLGYSTILSALVSTVGLTFKLSSCFRQLQAKEEKRFDLHELKEAFPYCFPVMFQQSVMYFAGFLLSPMVNALGASATASYSITNKVYNIIILFYQSANKTVGIYVVQCIGAKKPEKIRKGIRIGYLEGNILTSPLLLIGIFFPAWITGIFFSGEDALAITYSMEFCRFFLPFILFNIINNLFHNVYRGVKQMQILFISTLFGSVVRILSGMVLTNLYGMRGFYAAWALAWIAEAALCAVIYYSEIWIPKDLKPILSRKKSTNG